MYVALSVCVLILVVLGVLWYRALRWSLTQPDPDRDAPDRT
jgi:hypothetical protein